MVKLNFQQSLLQSSVSNNPSEMILICWFGAQETFLIYISLGFFNKLKVQKNNIYVK